MAGFIGAEGDGTRFSAQLTIFLRVKRLLDVRKASFLAMDRAVEETGMEYGGITPLGLPEGWRVLVDEQVVDIPAAVIGSGVRRSKLVLPGAALALLPAAEVVEGLGLAT